MNSHEFALHVPELSKILIKKGSKDFEPTLTLAEQELVKRIKHVLRLEAGEQCILFDRTYHAEVVLTAVSKTVQCTVKNYTSNKQLEPKITCLLPLLKREALTDAIYAATELGATEIQLVITEKIQRQAHDQERLERIVIAAAEQSKNFALPTLVSPQLLSDSIAKLVVSTRIFFDPQGNNLYNTITQLKKKEPENIVLLIGPEGDLSEKEKEFIKQQGFEFCALTPTVLRAPQALTVGLGALRSSLKG